MNAVEIEDRTIPGPHGPLPLRSYGAPDSPGLLWVHGGAYAFGSIDMPESDWVARELALRGAFVVAVEYRLAPKFDLADPAVPPSGPGVHFPVASDEVLAAYRWTRGWIQEHGGAPELLSIGGASAGANLAAGVALRLRDAGESSPQTVVLAYPSAHAELPPLDAELAARVAELPPLLRFPPEVMRRLSRNYLGEEEALTAPYAFVAGHDLRGLPPVLILNSDQDPLRASGEALAAELVSAGVTVTVLREPETRHGHLNRPEESAATRSIERIAAWLGGRRAS